MNERQARKIITKCLLKGINGGDIKPIKGYSSWSVYQVGNYLLVVSAYFVSVCPCDTSYETALRLHTKGTGGVRWWHDAYWLTPEGRQDYKIREALSKANYHHIVAETPPYEWVIPCD